MRILLSTSALALIVALASPASAQMCGGGQMQAQSQGQPGGSAGMCGMGTMAAPAAGQQAQSQQAGPQQTGPQQAGMCGCCRNMAMMQSPMGGQGMMDGQGTMQDGQGMMPGMNMPSQGGTGSPQSEPKQQ